MRTDRPKLMCDRCRDETQSLTEMARFAKITHDHASGRDSWDLCPPCWSAFHNFLGAIL